MLRHEMRRQGDFLFRYRSYLPLLLVPFGIWQLFHYKDYLCGSLMFDRVWDWGCFALALIGSGVRFASIGYAQRGTSGRNAKSGQIADMLNRKGMYSVVRHPLYLGNLIMYTAILLFTKSPMFALAGALALFIYYERIIAAEEAFLFEKFGSAYEDWAATTPYLIPRFHGWIAPGIPFSFRAATRSEIYSVTAIAVSMFVLDLIEHFVKEGKWYSDPEWSVLVVTCLVAYFVLRYLRKHTSLLDDRDARMDETQG